MTSPHSSGRSEVGPIVSDRDSIVVAFDLDDTLFPELDYARSALYAAGAEIRKRLGVEGIGERAAALLELNPIPDLPLQRVLQEAGITPTGSDWNAVLSAMHNHIPAISVFPGTMEVLENVRKRARIVLVSEGRSVTQRRKLEALDLAYVFDAIFITEELTGSHKKESGVPYAALRADYSTARRFIMIGDDYEKDSRPARSHDFETALVRRPGVRYVKASPPVETLPSLADAVLSLGVL